MCWYIKINNNIHMWNVQAPASHICGDQNWAVFGLELVQGAESFWLKIEKKNTCELQLLDLS